MWYFGPYSFGTKCNETRPYSSQVLRKIICFNRGLTLFWPLRKNSVKSKQLIQICLEIFLVKINLFEKSNSSYRFLQWCRKWKMTKIWWIFIWNCSQPQKCAGLGVRSKNVEPFTKEKLVFQWCDPNLTNFDILLLSLKSI